MDIPKIFNPVTNRWYLPRECAACGETDQSKLVKRRGSPEGLRRMCKECLGGSHKLYSNTRQAKRVKIEREAIPGYLGKREATHKEWRESHPEQMAQYKRDYQQRNLAECRERQRLYAQAKRDRVKADREAKRRELVPDADA